MCEPLSGLILKVCKPLSGSPAFFLGYHSLWQSLYNSSLSLTFQFITNPPSAKEITFTGLADYICISMLLLPFGYSELIRLLFGANSSMGSQYFLVLSSMRGSNHSLSLLSTSLCTGIISRVTQVHPQLHMYPWSTTLLWMMGEQRRRQQL